MALGLCRRVYEYERRALTVGGSRLQHHSFDDFLQTLWNRSSDLGHFRYRLKNLETKILPGKYGFVAQLNPDRALKRRKPQYITDVVQPFNENIFNFRDIRPEEVLFELRPLDLDPNSEEQQGSRKHIRTNLVILNVSPLEYCNCLLVPDVYGCHPQIITPDGLRLAVETMLLSKNRDLRIGFNSLGAYASVNHLHFHLYYLKQRLYLETSPVTHLVDKCFAIADYPAEGFAFEIADLDIAVILSKIMTLISYFLEKRIAHNIFLTRGHRFCPNVGEFNGDAPMADVYDSVRIFVWARKFSEGAKNDFAFNPALCELAGHLPVKTREFYDRITEDEVASILENECHEMFVNLLDDVKGLFSSR